MTAYRILINVAFDGRKSLTGGWAAGEPLVQTWMGEIAEADDEIALEAIFARHNRDDRPAGRYGPSLSVGDVVVLADVAWAVDQIGFTRLLFMPRYETERTWLQIMREQQPTGSEAAQPRR